MSEGIFPFDAERNQEGMKAVRLVEPFKFEMVDIEKPVPKDNEILVKVLKVGICGSDVSKYSGEHLRVSLPAEIGFPGHEAVGVVEESRSRSFKEGDFVLIEKGYSFKEYVSQADDKFLLLPDNKKLDEFVCSQPLGTVVHCFHKLVDLDGKKVVVLGQGPTGLLFNSMFKLKNAEMIIGVDILDYRLAVSRKLGATHTFNNRDGNLVEYIAELTDGKMTDLVVEAVGYQETYREAFKVVKRGGRVIFFGMIRDLDGAECFNLNFDDVFRKEINIISSYGPHLINDIKVGMELINTNKVDVRPLITHHFAFDDVSKAFEIAYNKETNPIKVIVDF